MGVYKFLCMMTLLTEHIFRADYANELFAELRLRDSSKYTKSTDYLANIENH